VTGFGEVFSRHVSLLEKFKKHNTKKKKRGVMNLNESISSFSNNQSFPFVVFLLVYFT
jgi:hypothetical protein